MLRYPHLRILLAVIVCIAMAAPSVQAQKMDIISNGQIAAILVGAGVIIGLVVYLIIPKQKTIEGCVGLADNSMKLKGMDGKTYVLEGDAGSVKPGQHMKLKGKRSKDKSGTLRLSVRKVVKNFGACTTAAIQ